MNKILMKAFGIWLLFVTAAMLNGVLREMAFVPLIGNLIARSLSAIILSGLIFIITYLCLSWIGKHRASRYWFIGIFWLILAILFEFIFGHYVAGESWEELFQAYNLLTLNLWPMVLLTTFISPYLCARIKNYILIDKLMDFE